MPADGLFYCPDCFTNLKAPRCGFCKEPITGDIVNALGDTWCDGHFVCIVCGEDFPDNKFFKHEEQPYCETHYLEITAGNCAKCGTLLKDAIFEALNKRWHPSCFTCAEGGHVIDEKMEFHDYNEKIYCSEHFSELFLIKCAKCALVIKDAYISVLDQSYHNACWTCHDCQTVLTPSSFTEEKGDFFCKPCKGIRDDKAEREPLTHCPKCGEELHENAIFCGECGAEVPVKGKVFDAKLTYPYSFLKTRPCPKGLDPTKKESYLSESDFKKIFGIFSVYRAIFINSTINHPMT